MVRFEFETAGQQYVDFDLITIKFDKFLDEEAGRRAAEETATRWFKERGTDAVLLSCVAKHTRELIYWPDNKVPVSTPKLVNIDWLDRTTVGACGIRISHPGVKIPDGWFTVFDKPFVDPATANEPDGETSDLVLIDLDGNRETFVTGCYHFPCTLDGERTGGWWRVDEFWQSSLDEKNMRWSYLPLARYEKK